MQRSPVLTWWKNIVCPSIPPWNKWEANDLVSIPIPDSKNNCETTTPRTTNWNPNAQLPVLNSPKWTSMMSCRTMAMMHRRPNTNANSADKFSSPMRIFWHTWWAKVDSIITRRVPRTKRNRMPNRRRRRSAGRNCSLVNRSGWPISSKKTRTMEKSNVRTASVKRSWDDTHWWERNVPVRHGSILPFISIEVKSMNVPQRKTRKSKDCCSSEHLFRDSLNKRRSDLVVNWGVSGSIAPWTHVRRMRMCFLGFLFLEWKLFHEV